MRSQHSPKFSHLRRWALAYSAAILLAAAPLVSTAAHAAPADELSWGIKPGGTESRTSFSYELDSGKTQDDSFVVTNLGATEATLAVYAADGITSSSGALDLLPVDEASTVIGAWVAVKEPEITLSPGETEEVDFSLTIPDGTEPGDYVGGLISSFVDTTGGGTVVVDRRLATQISVRVGGEGILALTPTGIGTSTAAAWNPFAPTTSTVQFDLANTGTVRARGNYTITVSGPFGLAKKTRDFAFEEMIPGGAASITQELEGIWPLFRLNTEVAFTPEGIDSAPGETIIISNNAWAIPWGQGIGLLLVIIIAVIIGVRRGRDYEDDDFEDDETASPAKSPAS